MTEAQRRVAIVTGGSSGIGEATAVLLAERGFDIGLTYRANSDGANSVAARVRSLGGSAVIAQLDVRDGHAIAPAIDRLVAELGRVDVLVNNAGRYRQVEAPEDWAEMFAVHVTAPFLATRAVTSSMRASGDGGRVVNVTSILATEPQVGSGAYCAAKAALAAVSNVLALELAPYGILVNAVSPGHIATLATFGADVPDARDIALPVIPLSRPATATEVASTIAFLASAEASYITGASLLIDGGLRLVSGPQVLQDAIGAPPPRS